MTNERLDDGGFSIVVDLGGLDGEARSRQIADGSVVLCLAPENIGFPVVVNHGVPAQMIVKIARQTSGAPEP
jgi:hypothetical protein